MPIRYDNPREIGPDRLVNAVAGYDRVGGAVRDRRLRHRGHHDVVSADGEYLGGVIFPGVEISLEALSERAAALPTIDLAPPRALIGKSTVDAIRAGMVYGFAGMVDGIIARLHAELGTLPRRSPPAGWRGAIVPLLLARSTRSTTCSRLTGLRLLTI